MSGLRVLWLTNDLPPRTGGIEQFVANLARRAWPEGTLVLGPGVAGTAEWDRGEPYRVERLAQRRLLPTPPVLRQTVEHAREHRPDVVVLGASWPLGELAPYLVSELGVPVVALTHGLEAGLAAAGLGILVRRAIRGCTAVTTISRFTAEALAAELQVPIVEQVAPGVDDAAFAPDVDGAAMRERWGVPDDALVVGCVSRLVRRKGQDILVDVWSQVQARHPDAWLVLVGDGPLRRRLAAAARDLEKVVVPGSVAWGELPAAYAALDLFAMPCRTRLAGTDVEGLGIAYLEAQSSGVPVVAGRSGGAPETVLEGRTGVVVDGTDRAAVAAAVADLLEDRDRLAAMGRHARRWVEERWTWSGSAERFRGVLDRVVSLRNGG